MTDADRELLELAAKAAGIELRTGRVGFCYSEEHDDGIVEVVPWNPLTDDGDALRLAVKLGIWAMPARYCGEARIHFDEQHEEIVTVWLSEANSDPYAATRRAIVRAAAEIGKWLE